MTDTFYVLCFAPANVDRRQLAAGNGEQANWEQSTGHRLIYEHLLPSPVIRNRASNMQSKLQLKLQLHKSKSNSFAGDFARGHVSPHPQTTRLWTSQVISQANEDIASSSSGLIEMLGSHLSTCGRSRRWSCFRTGCCFGGQDEAIANLSARKALQSGSNQTIRRGQVRQSTLVTICKVVRQEIRNSSACPYIKQNECLFSHIDGSFRYSLGRGERCQKSGFLEAPNCSWCGAYASNYNGMELNKQMRNIFVFYSV